MKILRGLYSIDVQPVALTIGNFDGVHLGHQALLNELRTSAQARGLQAAVVIFEPHPREFFAPDQAPTRLTSLREKLELLAQFDVERVQICRDTVRNQPRQRHCEQNDQQRDPGTVLQLCIRIGQQFVAGNRHRQSISPASWEHCINCIKSGNCLR